MSKHFNTFLKLAIVVILVIAAVTKQNYNYYIFVHWSVFVASIYLAIKSRANGIFAIVLFGAFAVIFNPIREFIFRKEIWRIIDFIVSALIILSIDWKGYKESLSPRNKLIYSLIKQCFIGIIALIAAFWFVIYSTKVNPYYEFMLITKSKIADGFITNLKEYEDEVEIPDSQGGGSKPVTVDDYEYTFTTQDGKAIDSWSSDIGYIENFTGQPLPIKVEYLPDNPEINRVKDETNQCNTIGEFIWRRLVLGILLLIMFSSIGYHFIRIGIKDYTIERKKLIADKS
jgi:Family of unknown function (DUF6804)